MRRDAESIRTALKADLLSPEFRESLRQVYAEHGDEASVEYPQEVYRSIKWAPQIFPCGEIDCGPGRNMDPNNQFVDVSYEVTVFWNVTGSDEERLEDAVNRIVGATRDYYSQKIGLEPYLMGATVSVGDEDYSPFNRVKRGDDAPLIKSGALTLFVRIQR